MKLKQSIAVDTSKLGNGVEPISADIVALKSYLRENPKELYAVPQLVDAENPLLIVVLRLVRKGKQTLMTMINPMLLATKGIIASEETQKGVEGTYLNFRHTHLQIAYNALPGCVPTEVSLSGKSALVFQQALRLTQGISVASLGLRIDNYEEYQKATDEEKQEIFKLYVAALKEVNSELLEDEETAEYVNATEFVSAKAQSSIEDEFNSNLQDAREEIVSATKQILTTEKEKLKEASEIDQEKEKKK